MFIIIPKCKKYNWNVAFTVDRIAQIHETSKDEHRSKKSPNVNVMQKASQAVGCVAMLHISEYYGRASRGEAYQYYLHIHSPVIIN